MLDRAALDENLADLIYEAAFEPDRWEDVIGGVGALAGADCGAVTAYRDNVCVGARLTGRCVDIVAAIPEWSPETFERRAAYLLARPMSGFFAHSDHFPASLGLDTVAAVARDLGIPHQVGMMVPVGTEEMAIVCVHRRAEDGPFSPGQIALLNRFQSHLGRASLVAARLGLERAQAATSTLNALGVPAAVLSVSGRVRASNALMDGIPELLTPLAFGGVAIRHPAANRLFQDAVAQAASDHEAAVRSIPIPAPDGGTPFVLHVLPLKRSAYDIFGGADALLAVTRVGVAKGPPSPALLTGLFDLTPAEVRLACALAPGLSLKDAADACGIRHSTARAYLDFIFRKTGTHRQSELVALLNSAQPPR